MKDLRKKRLGQYFSGHNVAELLTSLCTLSGEETVIDPMAGVGDMLEAVIRSGVQIKNVCGIEIDYGTAFVCNKRIQGNRVFVGDAFSLDSYEFFEETSWDVVITNPPYVRYQTISKNSENELKLKNAAEIRSGLNQIIDKLCHLTIEEKSCFQRIIKNYSGLSDLAVPAWLLCAALVKHGGILAMVVPESWISRDYAISIKYLLLKFFNICFIVEDLNAAWFSDAQIKTNLVIARRTSIRNNFLSVQDNKYLHLSLGAKLIGESSLVENLVYDKQKGTIALNSLITTTTDVIGDGFELKHISMKDFFSDMVASQTFQKKINKLEINYIPKYEFSLPKCIRDVTNTINVSQKTVDITAWGFNVGQGLRTGANKFFYTKLEHSRDGYDFLVPENGLSKIPIKVSQEYSIPALRYLIDANNGFYVTKDMVNHRLLYIGAHFFDENGKITNSMNKSLAEYIKLVEKLSVETGGKQTKFTELSAVKSNTRKIIIDNKTVQRYWFMLPTLTRRHLPQLCVSRLNYKKTRCLMVEKGIVVDANFSTLWTESSNVKRIYAMLALMNSSWVQAYLECIASVMGGGALKVESTHLRQIRLPIPTDDLMNSLSYHGRKLVEINSQKNERIISDIDALVFETLYGRTIASSEHIGNLCKLIQTKLEARKNRRCFNDSNQH